MAEFVMRYSRTFERTITAADLATAAENAKRTCANVTDCKLLAVWDPRVPQKAEEHKA